MRAKLDSSGEMLLFECPGCEQMHGIYVRGQHPSVWGWNGSLDLPTVTPSILVRWTHGEAHEPRVCHSFLRDGQMQFLCDCTHALAGQVVDLPDVDRDDEGA